MLGYDDRNRADVERAGARGEADRAWSECPECGKGYDTRCPAAHQAVCNPDDEDPAFLVAQDEWAATQVGLAAGLHR